MNNNGVIDEREDDDEPDYPYEVGQRGWNVFSQYKPTLYSLLTAGYHRARGFALGDEARTAYVRLEYDRDIPFWAKVRAVGRSKRVHDDIADRVFGLGRSPIYLEPEPIPLFSLTDEELRNPLGVAVLQDDPLLLRDSWMHTVYAKATLTRFENFTAEISVKNERNYQQSTALQSSNVISDLAVVYKSQYLWNPWKKLLVRSQIKWLHRRLVDNVERIASVKEHFLFPILRLEYPVSDRTSVKIGAQGIPLLPSLYRNQISDGVDFDSRVYLAQVNNTSMYLGYQVNVNLGYERRFREFLDKDREQQNTDYSRVFLRVIAGLRPLF